VQLLIPRTAGASSACRPAPTACSTRQVERPRRRGRSWSRSCSLRLGVSVSLAVGSARSPTSTRLRTASGLERGPARQWILPGLPRTAAPATASTTSTTPPMTMAVIAPCDSRIGAGFAANHDTSGAVETDGGRNTPFIRKSMGVGARKTLHRGRGRSVCRGFSSARLRLRMGGKRRLHDQRSKPTSSTHERASYGRSEIGRPMPDTHRRESGRRHSVGRRTAERSPRRVASTSRDGARRFPRGERRSPSRSPCRWGRR
jgi:hypothetical protein